MSTTRGEKTKQTNPLLSANTRLTQLSLLLSRIIYCSSLFIPLFQFINNNYRFKSQTHLQSIQTYYIHAHYNRRLNNGSLSWHVWIEVADGYRQRAAAFLWPISSCSTNCAEPLQHVSDHHYHSSAIYSSEMEILRDRLKEKKKKKSIALNFSFTNLSMTVQSLKNKNDRALRL